MSDHKSCEVVFIFNYQRVVNYLFNFNLRLQILFQFIQIIIFKFIAISFSIKKFGINGIYLICYPAINSGVLRFKNPLFFLLLVLIIYVNNFRLRSLNY